MPDSRAPPRIRPARQEEAPALSALAFESKAHWGYAKAQLAVWKADLTLSPDSIEKLPTFVAETGNGIAGFYQLSTAASGWALEHFWVRPRAMHRGIGRALLAHAASVATAAGSNELSIDADPHAEAFYLASGAQRVAVVSAPVPDDPGRVRPQLRLPLGPPHFGLPSSPELQA